LRVCWGTAAGGTYIAAQAGIFCLAPGGREILSEFCLLRHGFSAQLPLAGVRCGPLAKPLAMAFLAELDFTAGTPPLSAWSMPNVRLPNRLFFKQLQKTAKNGFASSRETVPPRNNSPGAAALRGQKKHLHHGGDCHRHCRALLRNRGDELEMPTLESRRKVLCRYCSCCLTPRLLLHSATGASGCRVTRPLVSGNFVSVALQVTVQTRPPNPQNLRRS
jgi:hypothetical protein